MPTDSPFANWNELIDGRTEWGIPELCDDSHIAMSDYQTRVLQSQFWYGRGGLPAYPEIQLGEVLSKPLVRTKAQNVFKIG
jgi:hypothetical protein